MGICKGSAMYFADVILIMKLCECVSCPGLVPHFQPHDNLLLYADRPRSPGGLQPLLVCQVAMSWSRPGGERPEVQ